MNLLIDVNVFAPLFNSNHADHNDFKPVVKSINDRKSKMVYGGTKFLKELSKAQKYQSLILEWVRAGKAKMYPKEVIDSEMTSVKSKESNLDFDDEHLVAIVIVAQARVVCTLDKRAERFLKELKFYTAPNARRPSIYKRACHINLLPV